MNAMISSEAILALEKMRAQIGPVYGSEAKCVVLYGLARQLRPSNVLELGSGLGVTTLWLARALLENGSGAVLAIDNASHFSTPNTKQFLSRCFDVGDYAERDYQGYLEGLALKLGFEDVLSVLVEDVSCDAIRRTARPNWDFVFSDYDHSYETCINLFAWVLPVLANEGSIFIDSVPSHLPSLLAVTSLINEFNAGFIPHEVRKLISRKDAYLLQRRFASFKLIAMPLVEPQQRIQNSTLWIKSVPRGIAPDLCLPLH
jgi:predicted O-methyltransferase YrrM